MKPACVLLVAMFVGGCATMHRNDRVVHVVVVWLKHPGDSIERQKLIDTTQDFHEIPGIISIHIGPVLASTRPFVDSNFDVALTITFRDADALRDYQSHPIHQRALRDVLHPLADKVMIYDFAIAK